ncbi:MAG: bifunctional ADP-heptose synthase [Proteobacteria bacterium]|nr:bifunctional ADP-heptose synthase [Pseudomonadota bacterium]
MKRFNEIIKRFSKTRVGVIGDMAADVYIYGKPYRLSREAPVIVIRHDYQKVIPGGAANTVNNLIQLGVRVYPMGIFGNDDAGVEVFNYFSDHCPSTAGLLLSSATETITKTRIMAGDDHTSKQQVIRIDKEPRCQLSADEERKLLAYLAGLAPQLDALIVSDYGYGFVTGKILAFIRGFARTRTVVADSRYRMRDFKGVTIVTPNQSEAEELAGIEIKDRKTLNAAGNKLLKNLGTKAVLITQGNEGMTLFERGRKPVHIPICGSDEITDVTGAGDTVASIMGLALGAGATFLEAAHLSNAGASVVVMKRGTATLTPDELNSAMPAGPVKK